MICQTHHSYRVFDEFLQRFVLERRSYITTHDRPIDFDAAFADIHRRYVKGADESKNKFDKKVVRQFADAEENTRIVFTNAEYLWAMPPTNIRPVTKRQYMVRWFPDSDVESGDEYFFWKDHCIANPGSWYLTNKYFEILSVLRILRELTSASDLQTLGQVKSRIAERCYKAIYGQVSKNDLFYVEKICGVHAALMHLSDPETYEAIISSNHKDKICSVFSDVVPEDEAPCMERRIKLIRERLYDSYGAGVDPDRKHRWFFYMDDVSPLWIDKNTNTKRRLGAAKFEVDQEEKARDLNEWEEGGRQQTQGYRIIRSAKLVQAAKKRDNFTCRSCKFHFEDEIVQAHHLNPLAERDRPENTSLADLITLCPNCHYLAHYLLRQKKGDRFKRVDPLLGELKKLKRK